jgi:malonyl CoA-acyl carrier protein transacylase
VLAFLFPGQGCQYVGMLKWARERVRAQVPQFLREVLDSGPAERLTETQFAQPAIGLCSMAALDVLALEGIRPDLCAGHSYGELVALACAGRLARPEFLELSHLRGRLMAEAAEGGCGGMWAVRCERQLLETVLAGTAVTIANFNSPRQQVLSGAKADLEAVRPLLEAHRIRGVALPVGAAFHSPSVAGAAGPFAAATERLAWQPAVIPVFAGATASPYPDDPQAAAQLLGRQLALPVEFQRMLGAMVDAGARAFVEVGPDCRLAGLVRDNLPAMPVWSIDASRGQDPEGDLCKLCAGLRALGVLH